MGRNQHTDTRRVDGKPETEADKRFFDLCESGYDGWIDQDGYAVADETDAGGRLSRCPARGHGALSPGRSTRNQGREPSHGSPQVRLREREAEPRAGQQGGGPMTARTPRGDAWMLPDDGIIDPVAVRIAASGERRVRLTAPERRAAAELIVARGGTVRVIAERLCMSEAAASALAYLIRNGYTRTPDREVA